MTTLFGREYSRRELLDRVGDMSQLAGTRKAELVEGIERGSDLIEVFNASGLCFSVVPGRALDIASAHYKGMSLCFRSSTGDVGPAFYEPQGNGWLRGFFGGLTVSCGMTFTGHPEVDPEEENEELGLHGRLAFLPAKNVVAKRGLGGGTVCGAHPRQDAGGGGFRHESGVDAGDLDGAGREVDPYLRPDRESERGPVAADVCVSLQSGLPGAGQRDAAVDQQ